ATDTLLPLFGGRDRSACALRPVPIGAVVQHLSARLLKANAPTGERQPLADRIQREGSGRAGPAGARAPGASRDIRRASSDCRAWAARLRRSPGHAPSPAPT